MSESDNPSLSYKDAGVDIDAGNALVENIKSVAPGTVTLENIYNGATRSEAAETVVFVTMRTPVDDLWQASPHLTRIGDAFGPSTIAAAVYGGHRYARELETEPFGEVPFRRELVELSQT